MIDQPRRLVVLAFSETCDRFAYYGMQSLLFLYIEATLVAHGAQGSIWGLDLIRRLLHALGDRGSPTQIASMLFGLFTGAIYLTTILGGWAADGLLGQRAAALWGGLLATTGYALLAIGPTFLLGLALLAVGSGSFRGNLAAELSTLYAREDRRRAGAYRLYFMAIMVGVLAAPLVCGGLALRFGYRWGFVPCGLGMLCGTWAYLRFGRAQDGPMRSAQKDAEPSNGAWSWRKGAAFALLLAILAVNLAGAQQLYNAYLAWAEKSLSLSWGGRTLPTTSLLALDSVLMLAALWIVGQLWRLWRRFAQEPEPPAKIALGCVCVALAYACLAMIRYPSGSSTYGWVLSFHMLNGLGFAIINPVALDLLTRSAPAGWRSRMASLFYLQFAIGSFIAGGLGHFLGLMPIAQFWLLHTAIFAGAGLVAFANRRWIVAALKPNPHATPERRPSRSEPPCAFAVM